MLDLELHIYRNGEMMLCFEDHLEGRDVTLRINQDGTIDLITSEPGPNGEDDTEGWLDTATRVNLHEQLKTLLARVEEQRRRY